MEAEANGYLIAVGGLCIVIAMALQLDSALLRNDVGDGGWEPRLMDTTFLWGDCVLSPLSSLQLDSAFLRNDV